ncbi:hypothetical protein [Alicyclobacillus kakegawensis]|uniref:hypothetical protein n=1 Tax=Alicyclobacillus kakegawensis TaxID=392012 RepID=UPI0008338C71|nr:hypothetical protein [Alicyclobacillus kakegawensis]
MALRSIKVKLRLSACPDIRAGLWRLRERQRYNGRHDLPRTDAELLSLAKQLYETLVPHRCLWKDADVGQLRLHGELKRDGAATTEAFRTSGHSAELPHGRRVLVSKDGVTFFSTRRVDDVPWPYVVLEHPSAGGIEQMTEVDDTRDGSIVLVRDPSGQINKGLWTRQDEFWVQVGRRVESYAVATLRRFHPHPAIGP